MKKGIRYFSADLSLFRKILCVVLIFSMVVLVTGCSGNTTKSDDVSSVVTSVNTVTREDVSSDIVIKESVESDLSSEPIVPPVTSVPAISSKVEPPAESTVVEQPEVVPCGVPFTPEVEAALNEMLNGYSGQVSVAFYDINSGYTYTYNAQHSYFVASVIKAPFCLYIYELADSGQTNLNDVMKYTSEFYAGGTGRIKNGAKNIDFSKFTLLEYAIRYSDNIALRMLRSQYPVEGFKQFAANLGISDVEGIKNITGGNITASDALVYMKEIYRFINSGSEYGQKLRTDMLNTTNPMIKASYPVVRKYGWADNSFHDAAIIEAPNPYILIILSDHENGTGSDFKMFETISRRIEAYIG